MSEPDSIEPARSLPRNYLERRAVLVAISPTVKGPMIRIGLAMIAALFPAWAVASAQEQQAAADAPRVFLDCHFCDTNFIRTEMNWVNWVRDAADAQIHVLVTRQSTGGGGQEWLLNF